MTYLSRVLLVGSVLGLAACSNEIEQSHMMRSGEERVFEIATDNSKHVSFSFELGSQSWEAASNCPEREGSVKGFMLQICGGLYNLDNEANMFMSMHGGGLTFSPTNGKLRFKLVNHADTAMDFKLKIEDAS